MYRTHHADSSEFEQHDTNLHDSNEKAIQVSLNGFDFLDLSRHWIYIKLEGVANTQTYAC
jgi:hypothetical protein